MAMFRHGRRTGEMLYKLKPAPMHASQAVCITAPRNECKQRFAPPIAIQQITMERGNAGGTASANSLGTDPIKLAGAKMKREALSCLPRHLVPVD
jgi:hypothetical protein